MTAMKRIVSRFSRLVFGSSQITCAKRRRERMRHMFALSPGRPSLSYLPVEVTLRCICYREVRYWPWC
jgi:hypothetical protein